jgi:hypothetical protein
MDLVQYINLLSNKWLSSRLEEINDVGNLPDFKDISIFYKTKQYYIYSYLNNILSCTLNWKLETRKIEEIPVI